MLTSSWAAVGVDIVALAQICLLGPYSLTVLVCPDEQAPGAEGPAQSPKSGMLVIRQACSLLRDSGPSGHLIAGKIGQDQPKGPLELKRGSGSRFLAMILVIPPLYEDVPCLARSPGTGALV